MWNGTVKYDGQFSAGLSVVWRGSPAGAGQAPAARRVKTQRPQAVSARTYGLDAAGEPVARLGRRGPGVGVATTRRGGAGRWGACLVFACGGRMSGMRRRVPLTKRGGSRGCGRR